MTHKYQGPAYYARVLVSMTVGLVLATPVFGWAQSDGAARAEDVCAEHGLVVRALVYPPKQPAPEAVRCGAADGSGDLVTYDLPGSDGPLGLGSTVTVLVGLTGFALGMGATYALIGVGAKRWRRRGDPLA